MSDNSKETKETKLKKEVDDVTGVETTGHEWDGLKELNNPAPRWWVWVYLICIVWSIGYWILFPAWPVPFMGGTGATKGILGWTCFTKLEKEQAVIAARKAVYLDKFQKASFEQIMDDPDLYAFAVAGGEIAFKDNCATCHGTGGAGGNGFPNLNDDDWLWGGSIDDIYQTIKYGIRSEHDETRISMMPSFGKDELLTEDEISAVVDYVLTLSGGEVNSATYEQGAQIFEEQCSACHGMYGGGGRDFGAPNLTDAIWLYGGDRDTVHETVFYARAGLMPTWESRLSDDTIRQLALYVHSLGGGE